MLEVGDKIRLNPKIEETYYSNLKVENIIKEHNLIGIVVTVRNYDDEIEYNVDFFTDNEEIFMGYWNEWKTTEYGFNLNAGEMEELCDVARNYSIRYREELLTLSNKVKKL